MAEPTRIFGLDFTSAPSATGSRAARRKDLTLAEGWLADGVLRVDRLRPLNGARRGDFAAFEAFLRAPGPWVAGLDFPFGQPAALVRHLGWPADSWAGYVAHVRGLGKDGFEGALLAYAAGQPLGRKHLRREADDRSRSISPMMLHYTPVAKMFYQGATRLLAAPVSIPPVRPLAGTGAVVLEVYPRLVVDRWIAATPYKAEGKGVGAAGRRQARQAVVAGIADRPGGPASPVLGVYGCRVELAAEVEAACLDDDSGDRLDSVLCALQAAWAAGRREGDFGIPPGVDPLEGWISDPSCVGPGGGPARRARRAPGSGAPGRGG